MPAVTLFLVRHGATDWNEEGRVLGRSDVELNDRGRRQAEALAKALEGFPLSGVIASPQARAQQTAEAIAKRHDLAVLTDPGLAEVWVTRWAGKTFAELRDSDPEMLRYLRDPAYACDAIEDAPAVQQRVLAVAEPLRQGGSGNFVLVSHGDPLRLLVAHYLGLDIAQYRHLRVATGSISVLLFGRHRRQLLALSWRPEDLAGVID